MCIRDSTILRTYDHTGRILTLDSTTGASLRYTRNGYGELEGVTSTGGSDADGAGSWESSHLSLIHIWRWSSHTTRSDAGSPRASARQ